MAETTSSERNTRGNFDEFLKKIQENNNEEIDDFLLSGNETAITEAEQRGDDTQQNLLTELELALRKSDVVAVWRLVADAEESEIKKLAALRVAEKVKRKEGEGLCTILRDSLSWILTFQSDDEGQETEAGGENVHEKAWINILTNPLYMCLEWLHKTSSAENETETVDIIKAALENACLLEKIAANESDYDRYEYRQRAMECEKFAIDIVEQIRTSDSGKLYKIMDIKGDGPLLNGNHENFAESLSLLKMAADTQRKMVRIVSLEARSNRIPLHYLCLHLKVK